MTRGSAWVTTAWDGWSAGGPSGRSASGPIYWVGRMWVLYHYQLFLEWCRSSSTLPLLFIYSRLISTTTKRKFWHCRIWWILVLFFNFLWEGGVKYTSTRDRFRWEIEGHQQFSTNWINHLFLQGLGIKSTCTLYTRDYCQLVRRKGIT